MADHPNRFAIGQRVLFRQRGYSNDGPWRDGTIVAVTEIQAQRNIPIEEDDWEPHADRAHTEACEGVYYSIQPGPAEPRSRWLRRDLVKMICLCHDLVVDEDGAQRWPDETLLRHRHELQLLWTDTGGELEFCPTEAPEGTDIISLRTRDGREVDIDVHDLLRWATGAEPEG